MNWNQVKEKSAGEKRLLLCWYIYRLLGTEIVRIIAFFVVLVTYILNKDVRTYSHNYFKILYLYSKDKRHYPTFINKFSHMLSYAYSLVDKMLVFSSNFNAKKIKFANEELKNELFDNIERKKGMFFICNHIGNVEVMRALVQSSEIKTTPSISIFLQKNQCEIFNNFINKISKQECNIMVYPIEDIDISTASEIEDKIKEGGIIFMAGDRVPAQNTIKVNKLPLFNKFIKIPIGVFKLAKMLSTQIYFVSCLKSNKNYDVHLSKSIMNNIDDIQKEFVDFMKDMILLKPKQFYNFYDIFIEKE